MYQINEIYDSIAVHSLLIDTLDIIKMGNQAEIDVSALPISNSKREFLAFYKEISHYYCWKDKRGKDKSKNDIKMEEMLRNNPELCCS
jgi:hypothetical protein